MRRRGPITKPGLSLGLVATHPLAGAPDTDTGGLGRLRQRPLPLNHTTAELPTPFQTERRVSVQIHPVSSLVGLRCLAALSLQGGPDGPTYSGTTPRHAVPGTDVTVLGQPLPLRLARRSPRRRELGRCCNSSEPAARWVSRRVLAIPGKASELGRSAAGACFWANAQAGRHPTGPRTRTGAFPESTRPRRHAVASEPVLDADASYPLEASVRCGSVNRRSNRQRRSARARPSVAKGSRRHRRSV